jgi:hypothetical protein
MSDYHTPPDNARTTEIISFEFSFRSESEKGRPPLAMASQLPSFCRRVISVMGAGGSVPAKLNHDCGDAKQDALKNGYTG